MTIERSVEFDAAAGQVWAASRTPTVFRYVTRWVLRVTGLPRTGRFGEGTRIEGWLLLGGLLPLHRHHLEVVRVDHTAMTLSSDEWGGVLRRWDHDIATASRAGASSCVMHPGDDRTPYRGRNGVGA